MTSQSNPNNNPKENFSFQIHAVDGRARAGCFNTPHGEFLTPVFAPVGTQAAVKAMTPAQLHETNASLVLANTYHLYLRPGAEVIGDFGSVHNFMGWNGPMLTDSGGFQVFSLAMSRKIDEDGVTFRSHLDGSYHRFTPEKSIEIQEALGADIIMAFDECAEPYDAAYNTQAVERTHAWAIRSLEAQTRSDQALFGIVQGGIYPNLREKSARFIADLNFPGNAIGGLSVGETKPEMLAMLDLVNDILPADKPRYLMGVGSPEDLVNGVLRGIDIFDCVLPTRLARHKAALTFSGRVNLTRVENARDQRPIEEGCQCYTCRHFSRAYLRHLYLAKESLVGTLVSIHNVYMLTELMHRIREAIMAGTFTQFAEEFLTNYRPVGQNGGA
ncbi:MAG: tRNA guanosine(34) transglycosylase Tgt [Chloroflexi bacterium]|nr:tRNA guanosine(34) transglycosylase Tgt [Chloroflexota bacterium]